MLARDPGAPGSVGTIGVTMLSRYARFAQALELTLYVVAGTWLSLRHDWPAWAVVVAAIACVLLFRLGIVATSVALGLRYRSPRTADDALDFAGLVRYFASEYRAWLEFNLCATPWDAWWLRPDSELAATESMPVMFVHGYFSNRGCFRPLVRAIEARVAGPVVAPNFRTWFASIEAFEEEIHAAIERVVAATGQPRVFVVAHSMGGLGMRTYFVRRGARRVAGMVTIACPHHGTALARLGSGENARQMRQGSVFLSELARIEETSIRPPIVSIYSRHDNLVSPQESARLPGARNVVLKGYGHLGLLAAPEVPVVVEAAMREAGVAFRT